MPFDQILPAVAEGRVDAGLLIHEGQLYYGDEGLHKVVDLGEWWHEQTGLPLPLGGQRGPQGPGRGDGLADRPAAQGEHPLRPRPSRRRPWTTPCGTPATSSPALADRFVGMYVNDWTVDYGPRGREAVRTLLGRAAEAGLVPGPLDVQFVG